MSNYIIVPFARLIDCFPIYCSKSLDECIKFLNDKVEGNIMEHRVTYCHCDKPCDSGKCNEQTFLNYSEYIGEWVFGPPPELFQKIMDYEGMRSQSAVVIIKLDTCHQGQKIYDTYGRYKYCSDTY